MSPTSNEVTDLLDRWSGGDENALDELVPLVFDDVREIARQHLVREGPGHTLQPTARWWARSTCGSRSAGR